MNPTIMHILSSLITALDERFPGRAHSRQRVWFGTLAFLCLGFFFPHGAEAVRTERVVFEGFEEFSQGEFENATLNSRGEISTASALEKVARFPGSSILWDAVFDRDGRIYAVTGNRGALFEVSFPDPDGESTAEDTSGESLEEMPEESPDEDEETPEPKEEEDEKSTAEVRKVFDPDQKLVRAVYVDSRGDTYLGTSPSGRIYRLRSGAVYPEVFFDPPVRYVWNLQEGPGGCLWITTGRPARIYRIDLDGEGPTEQEPWFETSHAHLMALAFAGDGTVLAGTGSRGVIYRIQEEGKSEVLADLDDREVSRIGLKEDGTIYFSAFRRNSGGSGEDNSPRPSTPRNSSNLPSSGFFRLTTDGFVQVVWAQPDHHVHDFSWDPEDQQWLLATGPEGRLIAVEDFFRWTVLARLEDQGDLNRLIRHDAHLYLAGSNPAVLYRLSGETAESSRYTSRVVDAGQTVHWGRMRLNGLDLADFDLWVRGGNTRDIGDDWTDWSEVGEGAVGLPPSRFMQYRLDLRPEQTLHRVELFFQLPNQPPVFGRVEVIPYKLQPTPEPPEQPQRMHFRQIFEDGSPNHQGGQDAHLIFVEETGSLTVAWQVRDPNEDPLEFFVYLRAVEGEDWILLDEGRKQPFHTIQTSGMAEGLYQFRIVASDRPGNPEETALKAETTSPLFLIDSTPPEIEYELVRKGDGEVVIHLEVTDNYGVIQSVSYRLNGAAAQRIFPVDGMYDSRQEVFRIHLGDLRPGHHSIVFEAVDESGNRAKSLHTFHLDGS